MGPVVGQAVSVRVGGPAPLRQLAPLQLPQPTEAEAAAATPAAAAPRTPSLSAFLAIAGAQLSSAARRALAKPVADGLDLLAELHAEVSAGEPSAAKLQALAGWARKLPRADDPELAALLREVETRALVELAKWSR